MDDLVKDFLIETYGNLERLDQDFIVLEQHPDDMDRLGAIFRTIHTIKGVSGFLDLTKLMALAHAGENLLARLRDGAMRLDEARADALLRLVDGVRQILGAVEAGNGEGAVDYAGLAAELDRLADPAAAPTPAVVPATAAVARRSEPATAALASAVPSAPTGTATAPPTATAAKTTTETKPADGAGLADASIRVEVAVLDRLMNLVGELVLTRNRLMLHPAVGADTGFQALAQSLNHLTSELQEGVMKTRMQPIGTLWSKLPRVVRDLARQVGKQVALEMDGQDTELDRTLIDALKDPMTHIVRNAIDHGIEAPEDRRAAGKPAGGVLRLSACHRSGHVVLTIADDGRGIDPARISAKAVEKGVITAAQAARLKPSEAVELVFAPGFSTADQVSSISGRGVGMDVVKTNIERIGGRVDLASRPGAGLTLTVTIPLTLAIVPALVLACAGTHFAIPQTALVELLRIRPDAVETVFDVPVHRLRGQILPLVHLRRLLRADAAPAAEADAGLNVLILQANDCRYGLVVDAIHNTEEIVVKPLSKHFAEVPAYAGATILGDGRLALILDVIGLARLADLGQRGPAPVEVAAPAAGAGERVPLLIVAGADAVPLAIRLDQVTRLEELPATAVERTGDGEAIQYRGGILPLVRLGAGSADAAASPAPLLQVVVLALPADDGGAARLVGLIVERIVDTVEAALPAGRTGRPPSLVLQGRLTALLDLERLLRARLPELAPSP